MTKRIDDRNVLDLSDLQRDTVTITRDEYSDILVDLDDARMDLEAYFNLFDTFLEHNSLRVEFLNFIDELTKNDEPLKNKYVGDLSEIYIKFAK